MTYDKAITQMQAHLNFERNHKCAHETNRRYQLENMAALVFAIRALKQRQWQELIWEKYDVFGECKDYTM